MVNELPRAGGVLLHPTSLPGDFGIGDLGPEAFNFVDFLVRAKQTYWQILPLGPTGYGDSPYQSFSAFAGNTSLISSEKLIEDGLLSPHDVVEVPRLSAQCVDFAAVEERKSQVLSRAFAAFSRSPDARLLSDHTTFCRENHFWLDDYALYRAIRSVQKNKPWYEWDSDLKLRDSRRLSSARDDLAGEIAAEKFFQFLFFRQWASLKTYANQRGVKMIGDLPIFISLDSSDVWCNQDKFKLNPDGTAKVIAGVPPDYYSKTGQLWGNPIYDWDAMRRDGFRWWTARLYATLQTVDVVRLDHFRGFVAGWEVPGEDETAENGEWVEVPGTELFSTLKRSLGHLPVIAEDLGFVTPEVESLRDEFEIPGMRILQFGFGGDAKNRDLPHNYIRHSVAYTGTHDNDTALGWFSSLEAGADEKNVDAVRVRDHCLEYLASDGTELHWDMIRAVWASVADTAIVPMQDLLGLGSEARMNTPATQGDNWNWRMKREELTAAVTERLKQLTALYGRTN